MDEILARADERMTEIVNELRTIPDTDTDLFNILAEIECVTKKLKRYKDYIGHLNP